MDQEGGTAAAEGRGPVDREEPAGLDYDEAVFAVVAMIPAGRVLSYGDIAELLGSGGPRQAGKSMGRSAAGTAWWRVVRADGTLPAALAAQALERWEQEGTPRTGPGVLMKRARWMPDEQSHALIDNLARRLPIPKRHRPMI